MPPDYQAQSWKDLVDEIRINEPGFLNNYSSKMSLRNQYLHSLPALFPNEQDHKPQDEQSAPKNSFILHHCDLREANILIDPQTFAITGIIDWEHTCTMPDWHTLDYPIFIDDDDPFDLERPLQPSASEYHTHETEDMLYNVSEYERWAARDLREVFDRKLEELGFGKDWRPRSRKDLLKSVFLAGTSDLSDAKKMAARSLRWIRDEL